MKKSYDQFWATPKDVMANGKLSLAARVIYGILYTRMNGENEAWPGQKSISDDTVIGMRTVVKGVKELVACGLIECNRRGRGKSNVYSMPPQEVQDMHIKKCTDDTSGSANNALLSRKRTEGKEQEEIAADAAGWSFPVYLKKMRFGERRDIAIIGDYWDFKEYNFETKSQAEKELRRSLRVAKDLTEYDEVRVTYVMDWLYKNADFKWTLETVLKYINDDLSKLKTKGRKN